MKVCPLPRILRRAGRSDPVDDFAARRGRLYDGLGLVPFAKARDHDAAQLCVRGVRNVYVEQHRLLERLGTEARDEITCNARGGIEMTTAFCDERNCDRGYAEQKTFRRRSDGA